MVPTFHPDLKKKKKEHVFFSIIPSKYTLVITESTYLFILG